MRIPSITSWAIFAGGVALILALQVVSVSIVYRDWGWNKSNFAQHFFQPLLVLAFLVCLLAPLFTARPLRKRLVASLLAGVAAALVYFGSSLAILILYGA